MGWFVCRIDCRMKLARVVVCLLSLLLIALPVYAQDAATDQSGYVPTRYGVSLLLGSTYDPETFGLAIVQGQMLVDYDRVAWHAAPESLRLKFEVNAGLTTDGRHRGLLAVNMLALRYLDHLAAGNWTPYVEAGIGLIYTDFQVKDQGLRINFNPQAGIGAEYPLSSGGALTMAIRMHHFSNSSFHKENRGVNSALLLLGYLF